MFCFAYRALNAIRWQDVDVGFDAHHAHDAVVERLDEFHLILWIGAEELGLQFYVQIECVLIVDTIYCDEVLRLECRERCQTGLYLRWEYVHAADDDHVV